MVEIYQASSGGKVYVGNDESYLKIKDNPEWKSARMAKYGPGGHKESVGYTTAAAPKGPNYLSIIKPNRIAINILDLADPSMVPFECIELALDYVKEQLDTGFKVLIACNSGYSRGPSTGLAFLRSVGDLPYWFQKGERIYKTLYPNYSPGQGIREVMKDNWNLLDQMEIK